MGIVPDLVGRCDLVLRAALAICAVLGRPRLMYSAMFFCDAVIRRLQEMGKHKRRKGKPAAAGTGPLGADLVALTTEMEWEAKKEEIFKDTPECLRSDKCTCQGTLAAFGFVFLMWWLWVNRAATVALKLPQ
eukprot:SAG31_NODE_1438_length_8338_cov_18.446413_1_plen_132_part_00